MITPETLTDAMIREFYSDLRVRDRLRHDCIAALSTDVNRRYPHETSGEFSARKTKRDAARQRICDAINARTGAKP